MRALALVGLGALVATAGACVALSGIGDYLACTDNCDDGAAPPLDASALDVKPPTKDGTSPRDVAKAVEEVGTSPIPEAGSPDDAEPSDVTVPPTDAGPDVVRPPVDSGSDGAEASKPEAGPGATCGALGTTTRCTASQLCCATFATQMNACTSSCDAGATLACSIPSDCPASKPICCAHMSLTGSVAPCVVTGFTSTCESTCADSPPSSCAFMGTIRLCKHNSDCTSDPTANSLCYNYSNAPTSWCSASALGGVEQM